MTPNPLLHLDLKPDNLLIDENWQVKVADFGISQIFSGAGNANGSPFYMSPEALKGSAVSTKSDVYSFGIVLWEMYTEKEPYAEEKFEDIEELEEYIVFDQERPKIPRSCPDTLRRLIVDCWAPKPADRPSFDDIIIGRYFEKCDIDTKIIDPRGREFWKRYFLTEARPTWNEFWACLITLLKVPKSDIPREVDVRVMLIKKVLESSQARNCVSRATFNKFLTWYGPLGIKMLDHLYEIASKDYFHGNISQKKAQRVLLGKKKRNQSFLLRYATRAGDFTLSVICVHRKKIVFTHHIITRTATGYMWLRVPDKGPLHELRLSVPEQRDQFLNEAKLPTYPTIVDLLKANRKALGIKFSRRAVCSESMYSRALLPVVKTTLKNTGSGIYGSSEDLLARLRGK
eukprot:TRINITY_DN2310_c0_g3_i1.p1 TRINITY_DN2310_c0_g3~~TRINITY_DN2310_c0_g3_i1.p1  ORF type:complete len:456 (-),score=70.61 TRINITY_DN2310_c0_g3_i1:124-1326(-)